MNNYVVTLGASAGGLDAIHVFFDNLPPDTTFSFVVIQHLSPDHKSLLVELLSKHTEMKVKEAEDGMAIYPNTVYVIPHRKMMTISGNELRLWEKKGNDFPNTAIDIFLSSLAEERKEKAVAVILSGAGSDGSRGIHDIKSAGGIVMIQDPETAKFDGMPLSSINTGLSDMIISPEKMPEALITYIESLNHLPFLVDINKTEEQHFNEIIELIKQHIHSDFSGYKRPTLIRRLIKRMSFHNIRDWQAYLDFMKEKPEEIHELGKEFLINVTRFFRDTEAFDEIKDKVLHELVKSKGIGNSLKIWSVGCSSGEEPYSLAILISEFFEETGRSIDLKIFATDLDKDALNIASKGIYPESITSDLTSERINKYFKKEGNNYRVASEIRKLVVFAAHNILEDPPFSKIDMIVCRNMLIYLSPNLQRKVFDIFQFSVNPGGFLFIGPSENTGFIKSSLLEINKKWKIYKFPIKTGLQFTTFPTPTTYKSTIEKYRQTVNTNPLQSNSAKIFDLFRASIEDELSFAAIQVTPELDVRQAIGNFRNYLSISEQNVLNFNLIKMVLPDLAITLGSTTRRAVKENQRIVLRKVKIRDNKKIRFIDIIIKPFLNGKDIPEPTVMIVLSESPNHSVEIDAAVSTEEYQTEKMSELEHELRETKETLKNVIQDLESTNEELVAANEELNSSNEEMNSSNEELQSLNEELYTINGEYQLKIKELQEANDDLNNYFRSANIGQIFLDKDLIIRKFTPAIITQFNLIESDIGRSISHISHCFKGENILNEIQNVIKDSRVLEKEIHSEKGRIYQMKIVPYVRQDFILDGAVLTFIDITEVVNLNNIISGVFNSSLSGILAFKAIRDKSENLESLECIALNKSAKLLLFPEEESKEKILGRRLEDMPLLNENDLWNKYKKVIEGAKPIQFEHNSKFNGEECCYQFEVVRMRDGLVITFTDITEKKAIEEELRQSLKQLKASSDQLNSSNSQLEKVNHDLWQFASMTSHDLKEPLRKIQTYGSILVSKNSFTEEDKNYLNKIMTTSGRMKNLIEEILNYTRLSNQAEFEYKPVDMNQVLQEVIDDMEVSLKEKNVEINKVELPHIEANPNLIRRVFQNFISNAVKFSKKDSCKIDIKHEIKEGKEINPNLNADQKYCNISFIDNGIGFDEKYGDQIFTLFKRLHSKDDYEGTGIGLAVCKKIADSHKGAISAQSKVNQGSKFTITLPLQQQN